MYLLHLSCLSETVVLSMKTKVCQRNERSKINNDVHATQVSNAAIDYMFVPETPSRTPNQIYTQNDSDNEYVSGSDNDDHVECEYISNHMEPAYVEQ